MISLAEEVVCIKCKTTYSPSQIVGTLGDRTATLTDLRRGIVGRTEASGRANRMWTRVTGRIERPDISSRIDALRGWTFHCPADEPHAVDGNAGLAFPVAIVGRSGASKSHFVPAIPWEVKVLGSLDPLDIVLQEPIWKTEDAPDLGPDISEIFVEHRVPPATKADEVGVRGPYTYRLFVQRGRDREKLLSLYLFDAPGEFFEKIEVIADQSPYLLLARSVIVLLDPSDLVDTRGQERLLTTNEKNIALSDSADLVNRIADAFKQTYAVDDFPVPVCFVLAKADAIDTRFGWSGETASVIEEAREHPGQLGRILRDASDRARDACRDLGLDRIVRSIEAQYPSELTRFALASATSQSVSSSGSDRAWEDPVPNGVGLALLQLLSMTGVLDEPSGEL